MKDEGKIPLLDVNNLSISFKQYKAGLQQHDLQVISDLSLTVNEGEILAVIGSSGSGKSLLAHAILGILPNNARTSGVIKYKGQEMTKTLKEKLRGDKIALVPQSVNYLDPLMKIGKQISYSIKTGNTDERLKEIFDKYELKPEVRNLYPFELSGGMARRALIATAVISNAKLIIADEPTPGLHSSVVKETLNHFKSLANEGRGILMITHDIDLAFKIADRIAVLYAGTTLEIAPATDFIQSPELLRHPYSKALWNALPQNGFTPISGFQPYAGDIPSGCAFAPRCHMRTDECHSGKIDMRDVRGGIVRCCNAT